MNENLAKKLLKTDAMDWTDLEWTEERKFIENFSNYKYDEYQQYAPGRRFIENLYLWLKQFGTVRERKIAYEYVKNNLIFISTSEVDHLIKMSYRDVIFGYLIDKLKSADPTLDVNQIAKIIKSRDFLILKERCLFLGLSDGAKIDVFRRHSGLDHEQVFPTYLIADIKTDEFLDELSKRLSKYNENGQKRFKIVFLVDDFSASGLSFIREKKGKFKGKLEKFLRPIVNKTHTSSLFEEKFTVCVLLYIATTTAKQHIKKLGTEFFTGYNIDFDVKVVQEIPDAKINSFLHEPFYRMIQVYYDPKIEDNDAFNIGDISLPFLGFHGCGLSVVLSHNCPNNSLPILWYHPDHYDYLGLFPRVERFPSKSD